MPIYRVTSVFSNNSTFLSLVPSVCYSSSKFKVSKKKRNSGCQSFILSLGARAEILVYLFLRVQGSFINRVDSILITWPNRREIEFQILQHLPNPMFLLAAIQLHCDRCKSHFSGLIAKELLF